MFTLQQITEHNKPGDIWITIHGKVYDVSEYLDDHPGGKDVLLEMAGSDATAEFDFVGHSIDAKKTLESFEVGLLAGYTSREKKSPRKQLAPSNAYAAKESSWPSALRMSSWTIKPWIYLILAVVGLKTAGKFVGRWVLGLEGFYAGIVTTSLVFAVLGWIMGFDALWGSALRNGTAQAIGLTKTSGILPSGSPLRPIYTGIPSLDRFLLSPVIFYDALMYERSPVYRSLLVSLFSTMQATAFCMIIGSSRNGRLSKWSILESMFWGIFNQSYGAAFVYPLYFFTHLQRRPDDGGFGRMETADAEALIYTSVIFAAIPAWLLYPSFLPCSAETRQVLIASYRAAPAILAVAQPVIARLIRRVRQTPLSTSWSRPLVKASLVLSGVFAALGHFYALGSVVTSSEVTWRNVFSPWATHVDSSSSAVISLGCHRFLQSDWLVIAAAVVPYASFILSRSRNEQSDNSADGRIYTWMENKFRGLGGRFVTLAGITLLFSPGATLSWALASMV
ncbi:hypothetical protein QBC46DRAFT_368113 [Diplogelasinospora grovesii]|uniref:Cytochrome b5 heme-binding domain-containing protein n=1 Tax=Diplogelasinospora grovesii TaxID=303347 RepID=A0AAN6MW54_9PEZI|nr:hypothetical protein QBC46DRAFT_368113 [Diplogelasinospora grovesii]